MLAKVCTLLLCVFVFVSGNNKCKTGYSRCAEGHCCCKPTIAYCQGAGAKLTFIPKLPDKITELQFTSNFLPSVNRTTFANIIHLSISKLYLNYDKIVNISNDAFVDLHNLRVLSMEGNSNINQSQLALALGSIQKKGNITIILRKIGLTEVKRELFKNLLDAQVSKIIIDDNQLTGLDFNAFEYLHSLQTLSAKTNRIRDISLGNGHSTLDYLILTGNEIARHVPKFCTSNQSALLFPKLSHVDLGDNFISELKSESWNCLKRLRHLSLQGNVIRIMPSNVFASLTNLYKLNIAAMNGNLRTIKDFAFNNSRLNDLNLQENSVIMQPSSSMNIFRGCPHLTKLVISGTNLKEFNEVDLVRMFLPLKKLESLVAVKCKIKHLPKGLFQLLKNLKTVIFDLNHIQTLGDALTISSSLSQLSLQSNKLRVLDKKSFPKNIQVNLTKLNLALNPFHCTCDMLWFRSATSDSGKVGNIQLQNWPKMYVCATPPSMNTKYFKDYHPTESECKNILMISLICVASLFLVISVVSIISYRYRWYIALWRYKLKPRNRNTERQPLLDGPDKEFRGYVIYDMEDRLFVHNDLIALVEIQMQYKLKIMGRDGGCGGSELDEMADSVYESEHVIAVISKASLANEWVKFQIDVALHRQLELKRTSLLLVLLEDINITALSKHWCVMFTKLPTARWCDDKIDIKRKVFEQQISQHLGAELNNAL